MSSMGMPMMKIPEEMATLVAMACTQVTQASKPLRMCCGLVFIATASLVITARVEEGENLRKFGDDYTQYLNETKMFVPIRFNELAGI